MAQVAGISPASVQRIWAANKIKPHLTRTFKLSNDPNFEEKFWDVIGLYLDPPDKALVLCCDEKSQVEALERTQPGLPLGIGHIRTQSHDYIRHGTITLFTALDYLEGRLISSIERQHRNQEWLDFLKKINRETPQAPSIAPDRRKLRHAQTSESEGLDRKAQALPYAFHPDLKFVD
ncbi:hypothetical protein AO070_18775 [Pseudomonas syringae pv. syringae PD2766]|nr:hypothetical protein AO070_18775 [Pseudomonas syringae pv. syringae PD2766]